MKNLNFFSNKLALVAIVAVSSIMLMSFQNAGSKKLDYLTKLNIKNANNALATRTMLVVPTGTIETADQQICVWGGTFLTVSQISYQTKMSKF